jgi:DNA-directed RNA polymerase specialized sigma24 family protein
MEDFTSFWDRNSDAIRRMCARYVGLEDSEDLFVEVWMRCMKKSPDTVEKWWGFISKVCQNKAIDWHNEKEKQKIAEANFQASLSNPDNSSKTNVALLFSSGLLDETQKEIFEMEMENFRPETQ